MTDESLPENVMLDVEMFCVACEDRVSVQFSDGAPMRSNDVFTMTPFDGSGTLILHHGCENGDEITPELRIVR